MNSVNLWINTEWTERKKRNKKKISTEESICCTIHLKLEIVSKNIICNFLQFLKIS